MKKITIIFMCLFVFIGVFSKDKEKSIKFNSRDILSGGEFLAIPSTPGYYIDISSLIMKFNYKDSTYTSTAADTIKIKSVAFSDTVVISYILDGILTSKTRDHVSVSNDINYNSDYGNELYIYIPGSQFSGGNSELTFDFIYDLKSR